MEDETENKRDNTEAQKRGDAQENPTEGKIQQIIKKLQHKIRVIQTEEMGGGGIWNWPDKMFLKMLISQEDDWFTS